MSLSEENYLTLRKIVSLTLNLNLCFSLSFYLSLSFCLALSISLTHFTSRAIWGKHSLAKAYSLAFWGKLSISWVKLSICLRQIVKFWGKLSHTVANCHSPRKIVTLSEANFHSPFDKFSLLDKFSVSKANRHSLRQIITLWGKLSFSLRKIVSLTEAQLSLIC